MKYNIIFISVLCIACNSGTGEPQPTEHNSGTHKRSEESNPDSPALNGGAKTSKPKSYSNQRFREVIVTKIDTGKYDVRGQAQMFEANFEWAVNSNGKEIKSGYGTTDAGAPAWGNFQVTIELEEKDMSLTYTLILFESSAKDGSRQHLLEIELD